jgi:hypothetical protein
MAVDLKKIMNEHNQVWEFETSIGSIQLQYLKRLDAGYVTDQIAEEDPEYLPKLETLQLLEEQSEFPEGKHIKDTGEYKELKTYIAKYADRYLVPCFKDPILEDVEELNALLGALRPDEFKVISKVFVQVTAPLPPGRIHTNVISICQQFGVQLFRDVTVKDLTVHQFSLLAMVAEDQTQAVKQMIQNMRDRQ